MCQEFNNIIKKFKEIKKLNYVESINNDFNGIGLTFEKLIGKEVDTFSYPDYEGIEIKTTLKITEYPIALFSLAPWSSHFPALDYLRRKYGYLQTEIEDNRKLNAVFYYDKNELISNRYFFNLKCDDKEEKLYLLIYDINFNLIDDGTYWYYSDLKEKLEVKLKYLALIYASAKNINNKKYYYYREIYCYKLKGFNIFLDLIKRNIICINITSRISKTKDNIDKMKCGCYFKINKFDVNKLFDLVYAEGNKEDRFL
ncbi:MAG: MvaI/BcnI family restriction endonuclease [bacterium]|nr:MvaI/BcnI family restriction endonuclease [bacterium]